MKKLFCSLILLLLCSTGVSSQDPVKIKKDQIYVEFLTDCNWVVYNLRGNFKVHAKKGSTTGFRAWEWERKNGSLAYKGPVVYRTVGIFVRDYLVFSNASFKSEFAGPILGVDPPWSWTYVIHFNELFGNGFSNVGTHMRVWGPCEIITLYHGEAVVTHGNEKFFLKVDENDYINFPPWSISLK